MTKSIQEIIRDNKDEIDRHLNGIADIVSSAGDAEPLSKIVVKFPEFRNFFIRWER